MEFKNIPVNAIRENKLNPNVMSENKFNFLVQNIQENGFIEPIAVVEVEPDVYEVFSGHHRLRAGKILGYKELPANVFSAKEMPEEKRELQLMRMNVIKGKVDPVKFVDYYNAISKKYGVDVAGAMLGLEQNELDVLLKSTREGLPPEMREKFDEVKKEIKTIDDLSAVLNHLFNTYGDTLEYNFMVFDYGGKKNLWIRCDGELWGKLTKVQEECQNNKEDINDYFKKLLVN